MFPYDMNDMNDMNLLDPNLENFMFADPMNMTLDNDDPNLSSTAFNTAAAGSPQQPGPNNALVPTGAPGGVGSGPRYQTNPGDENVPGAGPPPMSSFGVPQPAQLPGGSTLTEFTKRRNWPAKVVEELKDLLMILDQDGRVKHSSPSVTGLLGYSTTELNERLMRDYIHADDSSLFLGEFNECIATGNTLRLFYRLRKKDGSYAIFESVGHAHIAAARFAPNPNNQSPFCQAVFLMSRLYPAANAQLLDSFLEHKMENERLQRRIAELRREEAADMDEATRSWRQSQEGRSDMTPSEGTGMTPLTNATGNAYRSAADTAAMPPPERPNPLNIALTRENLEGVTAGNRPDSIRDKMARYEGINTIEMLTGLRYEDGERSKGITTGAQSPTLIKGDAGIAIPVDRDPRTGEKKKKLKVAEEYVCTDCGKEQQPTGLTPCRLLLRRVRRNPRFTRMAERPVRPQDTLQRLRSPVGQEGKEEEPRRPEQRRRDTGSYEWCHGGRLACHGSILKLLDHYIIMPLGVIGAWTRHG